MDAAGARQAALALIGVEESPHFKAASFRVKGRIFATLMPDGATMNIFLPEEAREQALALHPQVLEKLHWGQKAVGVSVRLAQAPAAMVQGLLKQAWAIKSG
ncbi:MmcQ/YjbR family DNA-binding protein [Arenimonas sp.]|uniref:MmcQ/YjbR family DNA-binding protein n=1 Tax=Arenimonas sp. TaxID=1872635 RepID=UPI0039E58251